MTRVDVAPNSCVPTIMIISSAVVKCAIISRIRHPLTGNRTNWEGQMRVRQSLTARDCKISCNHEQGRKVVPASEKRPELEQPPYARHDCDLGYESFYICLTMCTWCLCLSALSLVPLVHGEVEGSGAAVYVCIPHRARRTKTVPRSDKGSTRDEYLHTDLCPWLAYEGLW